jgi:hypothetical protein
MDGTGGRAPVANSKRMTPTAKTSVAVVGLNEGKPGTGSVAKKMNKKRSRNGSPEMVSGAMYGLREKKTEKICRLKKK